MKKLMIAAAIVCAAVIGNAANMYWGNGSYSIDNWLGNEEVDENVGGPMYKGGDNVPLPRNDWLRSWYWIYGAR